MKLKLYQINISEQAAPDTIIASGFPDSSFFGDNPDGTYHKENETLYIKEENIFHFIKFINPNWYIITDFFLEPDFYSPNVISSQWRDASSDEIVDGETTTPDSEDELETNSIDLNIENPNSLTLNYLQDAELQYHKTIDFDIELIKNPVSSIETEKSFKFKSKTDIASVSPNQKIVTDIGKDIGKKEYKNVSPHEPIENNPDFIDIT